MALDDDTVPYGGPSGGFDSLKFNTAIYGCSDWPRGAADGVPSPIVAQADAA
uniref:hypothetical protein n=1 Tax=Sphingomonas populi TaxID=2484750 RepID=UPI0013EE9242|nr:hypothetical protein [Sphingomonas populi]